MSKSTAAPGKINAVAAKPAKPYPDFPLFPHQTGRWAKKIRGKMYYFGTWTDPDGALRKFEEQKADLFAGRRPAERLEGLTIFDLCAKFLTTKKQAREAGELSIHSFKDYGDACNRLIKAIGRNRLVSDLGPDDFEKMRKKMAAKWGPVRIGNEINRIRVVFNYATKSGLLVRPIIYGEGFQRPTRKTLRKHREAQGAKMFEADEIRQLLTSAGQPLKSMILLGINCGFGNSDLGTIPNDKVNLECGWITYARPKTGIGRRCPLWPETVDAIREWLLVRPKPNTEDLADLLFLTAKGGSWAKATSDNPLSKEMRKLLDRLGINGHRNFYALRHTFQTVGDDSKDFVAVRAIMGHADSDIATAYRERITDDRLRAVAEHVRGWLFGSTDAGVS